MNHPEEAENAMRTTLLILIILILAAFLARVQFGPSSVRTTLETPCFPGNRPGC